MYVSVNTDVSTYSNPCRHRLLVNLITIATSAILTVLVISNAFPIHKAATSPNESTRTQSNADEGALTQIDAWKGRQLQTNAYEGKTTNS